MKIYLFAPLLLLLAGCELTTFEKAPLTGAACDARLVGHWNSVADDNDKDGEVQLDISKACKLEVSDLQKGVMRHGEPTELHVGQHNRVDYLWVDAAWAQTRFESDLPINAGDVTVVRYTLTKDELVLNAPDHKAIAHRILDDKIPGDTSKTEKGLQNRITGLAHPEVLEAEGFFSAEAIRFHRGAATTP
jgi:hypothetical protein